MKTFTRRHTIFAANLNHARHAQDLLLHFLAERDGDLAIIMEPYTIPENNPQWVG